MTGKRVGERRGGCKRKTFERGRREEREREEEETGDSFVALVFLTTFINKFVRRNVSRKETAFVPHNPG